MSKVYDEVVNATRMTSDFKDFEGDVKDWKLTFYEVWRYQMTWHFAYEIEVRDSRDNGAYIDLLVKDAYKQNALDMLEELGYKNIQTHTEKVAEIWAYEHDELDGIWNVVLEY